MLGFNDRKNESLFHDHYSSLGLPVLGVLRLRKGGGAVGVLKIMDSGKKPFQRRAIAWCGLDASSDTCFFSIKLSAHLDWSEGNIGSIKCDR